MLYTFHCYGVWVKVCPQQAEMEWCIKILNSTHSVESEPMKQVIGISTWSTESFQLSESALWYHFHCLECLLTDLSDNGYGCTNQFWHSERLGPNGHICGFAKAVAAVLIATLLINLSWWTCSLLSGSLSSPFFGHRGLNMIQNYLEEVTDKFPCTCSALYAASAVEPAVAFQATRSWNGFSWRLHRKHKEGSLT